MTDRTSSAPDRTRWVHAVVVAAVALVATSSCRTAAQIPVTATAAPGTSSWAPWPQAQHDARHSGASVAPGPTLGKVLWERTLSSAAAPAGPVTGPGGTAYLTDPDGVLRAIDLADGQDRWAVQTGAPVGGDLSTAPLVLPDGDIVTGVSDGLSAWSALDGHRVWHAVLGGGGWTSPITVDGSRIWVGSRTGTVAAVAVTAHRGRKLWTLQASSSSYGSVVSTGDGRVYTTSTTG